MTQIIKIPSHLVGLIFLVGQVVDAIFTPIFGYASDNINTSIGKRKPIYILGVIQVFFSIVSLFHGFNGCFFCDPTADEEESK